MNEQISPGASDRPLLDVEVDIRPQHLPLHEKKPGFARKHFPKIFGGGRWGKGDGGVTKQKDSAEDSSTLLGLLTPEGKDAPEVTEDGHPKNDKDDKKSTRGCFHQYRNTIAYWWLGFCNNFTYWVMITAAYDLLTPEYQGKVVKDHRSAATKNLSEESFSWTNDSTWMNASTWLNDSSWMNDSDSILWMNDSAPLQHGNSFTCQDQSTGAILVADTLPATAITLAAPLTLLLPVNLRVAVVIALCASSYLTLGLAHPRFVFLGVAQASASRGFSDSAFLGHASNYPKEVLSTWSSGTGAATFLGPLLYSSLTTGGFHPRHVLLVFLAIPVITALSFWCVLDSYQKEPNFKEVGLPNNDDAERVRVDQEPEKDPKASKLKENLYLFGKSLKYIFPLGLFYFIMYFTNQGLLELVYFPASLLTHAQQYSWSNTVRCLGTFISRSAHTIMLLPNFWIYNSAVLAILCVIGTEAYYHYVPSEYIIFTLLLIQGLLEGAAFRTTVFKIHSQADDKERSFSLGVFPSSLFPPALIAGLLAMPVHDIFCKHHAFKTKLL